MFLQATHFNIVTRYFRIQNCRKKDANWPKKYQKRVQIENVLNIHWHSKRRSKPFETTSNRVHNIQTTKQFNQKFCVKCLIFLSVSCLMFVQKPYITQPINFRHTVGFVRCKGCFVCFIIRSRRRFGELTDYESVAH